MLHIIWDLDGTLIDSEKEIVYTLELAISDAGLNTSTCIKPFRIGPSLDVMLREAFPVGLFTDERIKEIISCFRTRYDASNYDMTRPFPGIETIISDNQRYMHHIITNKPSFATKRIFEKLMWSDKITSITSPMTIDARKQTKTELFAKVIAEYGGSNSLFIGIGDMKADCIAAKENHIMAIGVLWGTGTREELIGVSDCLFADTRQLGDYLQIY
jgi:phosphoglycolate phosphatase